MNEKHRASLKQYVNDAIAMERDIVNAVKLQTLDSNIACYPRLRSILEEVIREAEKRIATFKSLSEEEGGALGERMKEGITAITGTFAGLYGRVREHPVSRMVRDNIIALDVAMTSYGMLLTLALAIDHRRCIDAAQEGLTACPPLVIRLGDLLPAVVFSELAKDGPLTNPDAAHDAHARIRAAWKHRCVHS